MNSPVKRTVPALSARSFPRPALAAALAVLVTVLVTGLAGLAGPVSPARAAAAPGTTAVASATASRPILVEVGGDAENGFDLTYHDGTTLYPPTTSESMAECGEYDTMRARVRCRTEVRTWYRDLADAQASLAWVREHG